MTIINTSPDRPIQLGYEGEDRVTVLRFRYSADWLENGEGIFSGEMQIVYSGADFVKKSPIYSYNVSRAVDEVADPPAQDVYTQLIESLSELGEDIGDIQTDIRRIEGNIGNLADLTTTAKTDLVSAINEVNEHGGGSATVDDALSATSTNPVQNKVLTARLNGLDSDVGTLRTSVQGKADTQTVSALADAVNGLDSDVQGLQTAVQNKVGDVQINGTSIVSNGVAEIPIAGQYNKLGLFKIANASGLSVTNDGSLSVYRATPTEVKGGTVATHYLSPSLSNYSTFYGLAKAAGDTTQATSSNAVGQYTEEAKTAIRTMLGLQEMYEWYKNQT